MKGSRARERPRTPAPPEPAEACAAARASWTSPFASRSFPAIARSNDPSRIAAGPRSRLRAGQKSALRTQRSATGRSPPMPTVVAASRVRFVLSRSADRRQPVAPVARAPLRFAVCLTTPSESDDRPRRRTSICARSDAPTGNTNDCLRGAAAFGAARHSSAAPAGLPFRMMPHTTMRPAHAGNRVQRISCLAMAPPNRSSSVLSLIAVPIVPAQNLFAESGLNRS
jgi:hypothetical protein